MKRFALFALMICAGLYAQKKPVENTRWTPEDITSFETTGELVFSDQGDLLAWTRKRPSTKGDQDKFVYDLYLTRLHVIESGKPLSLKLSASEETHSNPVFSSDGKYLYFLSSRDKGKKLWRLPLQGGEAQEVTTFKGNVSAIKKLGTDQLIVLSEETKSYEDIQGEASKDDVISIEDTLFWKPRRLFRLDPKTREFSRITNNTKPISNFAVSADGRFLVYEEQQSISFEADASIDPHYFLKDLHTGHTQPIMESNDFPLTNLQFSPDSKSLYFIKQTSNDPQWNGAGIFELYQLDLFTNNSSKIDLQWENGIGDGFLPLQNGVLVSLANGAYNDLAWYTPNKGNWKKNQVDFGKFKSHAELLSADPKGTSVILRYSTSSSLPQYHLVSLDKKKFTDSGEVFTLNTALSAKPLAKSEVIYWKGWNGEQVNGILYYPENYQQGKKYPLILSIHGGPMSQDLDQWSDRWSTFPNIWSQRGAFVLKPNYHGSSNHGLAFVESIKGNYYDPEMADIDSGINYLVERGMADPNKLAATGWSNGAILTTMLTVRFPDRFKAAAAGAGDVNWTSDFGTCEFGVSFDRSYFGGDPWDDLNGKTYNETYIIKSPLFEMDKVKTPTLIFHGSEDRAVPRDQGWEYFRALQQLDQAPVKFLWFPGQPHSLLKVSHQLRKMNEEIAWLDTYLFEKNNPANRAFKDDSPLAARQWLEKSASVKGQYGIMHGDVLIPETAEVATDSISIGRFEVTNAQFSAFSTQHSYPATEANYPAKVSLDDARAYLKWLSGITGKSYRLPNAEESKIFSEKIRNLPGSENTLDYWAGYEINPDDAAMLQLKINELQVSLIEEVGQRAPCFIGQAILFDLGGNLAEWNALGKTYGYSAYSPLSADLEDVQAKGWIGFRVIMENNINLSE